MNFQKIIKFVLMLSVIIFLFPKFTGGIFLYIIKFLFYLLLVYVSYAIIHDTINYIFKNWHKAHLLWIDEREHAKGNSLANLTRLDFLGATFRFFHYVRYNKRKIMQQVWYDFQDNMIPILSFVAIGIIVIGFFLLS